MFYVIDDHGDRYARAETAASALHVLDRLIASDARAADNFAVIELDNQGHRVGTAITRERPAPIVFLVARGGTDNVRRAVLTRETESPLAAAAL